MLQETFVKLVFNSFTTTEDETAPSDEPVYLRRMEEISITEEPYFDVDCSHLKSFDSDLYRQLICYPQVA